MPHVVQGLSDGRRIHRPDTLSFHTSTWPTGEGRSSSKIKRDSGQLANSISCPIRCLPEYIPSRGVYRMDAEPEPAFFFPGATSTWKYLFRPHTNRRNLAFHCGTWAVRQMRTDDPYARRGSRLRTVRTGNGKRIEGVHAENLSRPEPCPQTSPHPIRNRDICMKFDEGTASEEPLLQPEAHDFTCSSSRRRGTAAGRSRACA